mmetsp:Transcript_11469/g.20082  ORF Transcript_11469/g.20082 Transcript_11469/m.20082 type:complete len:82 (-) Transcript_11469:57-302(-)
MALQRTMCVSVSEYAHRSTPQTHCGINQLAWRPKLDGAKSLVAFAKDAKNSEQRRNEADQYLQILSVPAGQLAAIAADSAQ